MTNAMACEFGKGEFTEERCHQTNDIDMGIFNYSQHMYIVCICYKF